MKKNIILSVLVMSMILNPFSTFAETDNETNKEDNKTHTENGEKTSEDGDKPSEDDEPQNEPKEEPDDEPLPEEPEKFTLTFLDFDGKVIQEIQVTADEKIDYSQIDISGLHSFVDTYTEQDFSEWSSMPEYISEDTTIQALWKKGSISTDGSPAKTEYYSKNAEVDFTGLSVIITLEIQTAETDNDGNFIVETQENNITSACYSEKSLDELFEDEKTAVMNVIPNGDDKPIFSYEVTLFDSLGDTNNDNIIDAVDSSFILETYANLSTSADNPLDDEQKKICDINQDGIVDAVDASYILMYYAEASTSGNAVWENLLEKSAE